MQLIGRATISVDGTILSTNPGASLMLGGWERETQLGSNGVLGFSEKPSASELECEISVGATTEIEALRQAKAVTIQFETDIGKRWIMKNAWLAEPPKVGAEEGGKVSLKFQSGPAEEL